MAIGRVWAGFFHTRTRPAGQNPQPGPGPFTKRFFFGTWTHPHEPHPSWLVQPKIRNKKKIFFERKSETKILIYDILAQNHKHKHKFQIYDFHFSLSEIINTNTNTNTNSHDWGELNPEKKKNLENEVEWGRVTLVAMGEEDEMRGAEDCSTVWDRRRQGWNGVEIY